MRSRTKRTMVRNSRRVLQLDIYHVRRCYRSLTIFTLIVHLCVCGHLMRDCKISGLHHSQVGLHPKSWWTYSKWLSQHIAHKVSSVMNRRDLFVSNHMILCQMRNFTLGILFANDLARTDLLAFRPHWRFPCTKIAAVYGASNERPQVVCAIAKSPCLWWTHSTWLLVDQRMYR